MTYKHSSIYDCFCVFYVKQTPRFIDNLTENEINDFLYNQQVIEYRIYTSCCSEYEKKIIHCAICKKNVDENLHVDYQIF